MMNKKFPTKDDSREVTQTIFPQVTTQMLRSRTMELASSAGRSALEIRQSDYERAKRELTGETDFERQEAVLQLGR